KEPNLNVVDQPPAKDSESVVCDQTKVKTSEDPPLDFSFKDSVAGFDSLDWFWRTPSFEQLRVELSEEPLDLYLKDSFNSIASLRHVYVATEPEWVVSEPFVPVSCATVSFNETEVKKRDDQKHRGEKAKNKTPNDEILSISSSRRAEEKKSDDEEDKEGDDKRVEDSLRTKEATMSKASKELPLVPSVNLESSVLEEELQKNMATKRRREETKTCSTSNKKNKNEVVSPRRLEAETWLSLPYPYDHYPIRYQIIQRSSQMQHSSIGTEPLVTFLGQNRLNQPIGGIVGLSEFPQVIEEHCSPPNVPPLPNLNLQTHPQPHLGGRVRKEQP
ncbi:hypothetical protein ISN45_Aa08g001640, partial [Arabidopsis thaliana x Arabidopsis arenosa]